MSSDGELDNRVPGKVTGWIRFFRSGRQPLKAVFDLAGDFHEDIRGKVIRLRNPEPSDEYHDQGRTYMEGFSRLQRGAAGDITAGLSLGPTQSQKSSWLRMSSFGMKPAFVRLSASASGKSAPRATASTSTRAGDSFYPYVPYPYVEWYSDNSRVVLELDPSQVEIVESAQVREKSAGEFVADEARRNRAMGAFLGTVVSEFSEKAASRAGTATFPSRTRNEVTVGAVAPRRVGAQRMKGGPKRTKGAAL